MGLTMALRLKDIFADQRIVLIEKEDGVGQHASGRNSGVLHAGFYYTADSMKARFTRDGNREMQDYCAEKGLQINKCGKLVVCRNEKELASLEELLRRGQANGVKLKKITAKEARDIEPNIKTVQSALWSPQTASVDPAEIVASLKKDALDKGIEIRTGVAYTGRKKGSNLVSTSSGEIEAGYVVNTAGLYADKIAREFGFSQKYRILPFKGLYLYALNNSVGPRVHIYPVPDLAHPFLGVHFTLTVTGKAKIGPTAIPVFWRENYGGLDGINIGEAVEILSREARMWLGNHFGFRQLAMTEMKKYRKSFMVSEAEALFAGSKNMKFEKWGPPGIRSQLVDISKNKLEMDFIFEYDDKSFHLLNAVSPAFTCSLSISRYLADKIKEKIR